MPQHIPREAYCQTIKSAVKLKDILPPLRITFERSLQNWQTHRGLCLTSTPDSGNIRRPARHWELLIWFCKSNKTSEGQSSNRLPAGPACICNVKSHQTSIYSQRPAWRVRLFLPQSFVGRCSLFYVSFRSVSTSWSVRDVSLLLLPGQHSLY